MSPQVLITPADEKDISQIMLVEKDAFLPSIQEREEIFINRILTCPDLFLVFKKNEKIIGYICGEYIEEIPQSAKDLQLNHLPKTNCSKEILYISSFAILQSERGNGLGKDLWNESIKKFTENPEIKKILLLVNECWENARHIYQNSGFTQINCFNDFFPTKKPDTYSNGILMKKDIL